jgi:hypothetical protein
VSAWQTLLLNHPLSLSSFFTIHFLSYLLFPFTFTSATMSNLCGCCVFVNHKWQWLPQVALKAHATILSSAARTTLTQIFTNPSDHLLQEVSYKFPLYDGVSVVGFQCRVGNRRLHSKVKSKEQANTDYDNAVADKQSAAIMEHTTQENDVFVIRIGNVHAKEIVTVDVTFIGELKQDAQTDGVRYTLPNTIAPRYANANGLFGSEGSSASLFGRQPSSLVNPSVPAMLQGISITVDVKMEKKSIIRELQSPSHCIKTSLGRTSATQDTSSFEPSQTSATAQLAKDNEPALQRDFVLVVKADGLDNPRALLESHSTIPGQRALMATLVPKFNLPPSQPEVVFVIDRSGSMSDKIHTLQSSLKVFLKSLPLGICFNLCSFGNLHSFLWSTSRVYDHSSLQQALSYVDTIDSNMGGTELQPAVEAVVNNRLKGKDLEVLVLTDGQIWNQQNLFNFVRDTAADNTARFFSLGLGDAASHSLIEGIARSGNGVSQSVLKHEELDRKVVRMLKGALTPHIYDYKLQVEYDTMIGDDFEVVENLDHAMQDSETEVEDEDPKEHAPQKPISLFDGNYKESDAELGATWSTDDKNLPKLSPPKVLQAPYKIPPLYPFIRSTVYLILDPQYADRIPQSLAFSATSKQGPLKLRIPISDFGKGETIHQLASRKAVIELEELHGWLEKTKDSNGNPFTQLHSHTKQLLAIRECQALGIKYQVTGKHCSFVALEDSSTSGKDEERQPVEFEAKTVPQRRSPRPEPAIRYSAPSSRSPAPRGMMMRAMATANPSAPSSGGLFGNQAQPTPSLFGGTSHRPTPSPQFRSTAFGASSRQAPDSFPSRGVAIVAGGGKATPTQQGQFGTFGSAQYGHRGFGSTTTRSAGGLFGSANPPAQPTGSVDRESRFFDGTAIQLRPSDTLFNGGQPGKSNPATNTCQVYCLISLQTFEGKWELTKELCTILDCDMDKVYSSFLELSNPTNSPGQLVNVLATYMVMGFLKNKHADSRSVWELVYGKADTWLNKTVPGLGIAGATLDAHRAQIMSLEFLK